jgi:impB/mucB/samB family C-terminal domain
MQACVDASTLSSLNVSPTWAIRVAGPTGDGFHMAEELRGVPKPMLQTVFGYSLGRRIWELARGKGAQPGVCPLSRVSDAELSMGMVGYLSQQAAAMLCARGRLAKAIRLTITYADGDSPTARMHLATPTSEDNDIAMATKALLRRFPACGVRSIDLAVTSIEAASAPAQTSALFYSTASA